MKTIRRKEDHAISANKYGNLDIGAKQKDGLEQREDLRKKNLCFKCKEPWRHDHQCKRGRIHQIEETEDEGTKGNLYKRARIKEEEHGTIAVISQVQEHRPLRIKGTVKGQRVIALVEILRGSR